MEEVESAHKALERVRQERGGQAPLKSLFSNSDVPTLRLLHRFGWIDLNTRGGVRVVRITTKGRVAYKCLGKLLDLM